MFKKNRKILKEESVSINNRKGKICINCQRSINGGSYTAPWESGNNPNGYVKCPHCGCVNFEYFDD